MEYNEKEGKFIFNEEEHKLFKAVAEMQKEQYMVAEQKTKRIIKNKITDAHQIETTLDMLFEFLEDEDALLLYRRLCRYYWDIDRQATVDYINLYAEQYDPEHKKFGNRNIKNDEHEREDL